MPSRTVCAVLDEMRKCNQTHNYSYLNGLIEEVQVLANRMEAALWDQHNIRSLREQIKELKTELDMLHKDKQDITGKKSKPRYSDF
jgi:archaellum component FlaC